MKNKSCKPILGVVDEATSPPAEFLHEEKTWLPSPPEHKASTTCPREWGEGSQYGEVAGPTLDFRPLLSCMWSVVIGFLAILLTASIANADGGKVQLSQVTDDQRLTVFTSPTPMVSGPVDISFLVQDAGSGQVARQAQISVVFEHVESGRRIEQLANFSDSTNKMLQSAKTELTKPGQWNLQISVDSAEPVSIPVYLSEANPIGSWIAVIILAPLVIYWTVPVAGTDRGNRQSSSIYDNFATDLIVINNSAIVTTPTMSLPSPLSGSDETRMISSF